MGRQLVTRQQVTQRKGGHIPSREVVWVQDPQFLHDDLMYSLAHDEVERDRCKGCGQPLTETTRPDAEGSYRAHTVRCHACKDIHIKTESVDDKRGLLSYAERED